MAAMIKAAAEFQLRAMDTIVDFSSSRVASKASDTPLLRRLLNTCIRIALLIVPSDPGIKAPRPLAEQYSRPARRPGMGATLDRLAGREHRAVLHAE